MSLAVKKDDVVYTYSDYQTWNDDERWEIIHGRAYDMSPAPSTQHQRISRNLLVKIENYLSVKKCEVFAAPFDVRFPEKEEKDEDIKTVVQPDISVICDKSKLDDKGCCGAPDFIIEIVSPNTAFRDIKEKFFLYEKHRVKEYWIVHPSEKTVMVFELGKGNKYVRPRMYAGEDKIDVGVLKGLTVDLEIVFKE